MKLKCHQGNPHRVFVRKHGIKNHDALMKTIRASNEMIQFEDDESFRCLVRGMVKNDKDFTIEQLHSCIRAGGIINRIEELRPW